MANRDATMRSGAMKSGDEEEDPDSLPAPKKPLEEYVPVFAHNT